jgi:hypothetical protein
VSESHRSPRAVRDANLTEEALAAVKGLLDETVELASEASAALGNESYRLIGADHSVGVRITALQDAHAAIVRAASKRLEGEVKAA